MSVKTLKTFLRKDIVFPRFRLNPTFICHFFAAILKYLTDYWNRTNEPLQSWFVEEKSVEELQIKLELDPTEADTKFEIIKESLFQALNITVTETQQLSFDELDMKREDVKKRLEKYKKSTI